jgi:hypothetical protein
MEGQLNTESAVGEARWVRYVILFVTIANLFATTVAGYFFIGRYEAELYKSNKKLAEVQTDVAKIEANYAIKEKSEKLKNLEISSAFESMRLLEGVRPKIDFRIKENLDRKNNLLEIGFWVSNSGQFEFQTSTKEFALYINPVGSAENKRAGIDILRVNPPSMINPGEKQEHSFRVDLSKYKMKKVYYSLAIEAKPSSVTLQIVRALITRLGATIPDGYFTVTSTRIGSIAL